MTAFDTPMPWQAIALAVGGFALFGAQFWFAIRDQQTGIDGILGFFSRTTWPIAYWLLTSIWALGALSFPIMLVLMALGY